MTRFKINPLIALIVIVGSLAMVEEWQPVKKETLWSIDAAYILMGGLYLITVFALVAAMRRWAREGGSRPFTAFGVALAFIGLISAHRGVMSEKDAAPDVFYARSEDIIGDGILYFSFKKGNYVTVQKQDQWMETLYRGSYSQKGDTIDLDIPLDFPLGNRAVIKGDSLFFFDPPACVRLIPREER